MQNYADELKVFPVRTAIFHYRSEEICGAGREFIIIFSPFFFSLFAIKVHISVLRDMILKTKVHQTLKSCMVPK